MLFMVFLIFAVMFLTWFFERYDFTENAHIRRLVNESNMRKPYYSNPYIKAGYKPTRKHGSGMKHGTV